VLDGNVLRVGRDWVAIPPSRVPLVALLLERRGEVVRRAELVAALAAGGGSSDASAVRAALHRMASVFATVGLQLHSVRGRGSLLEATPG
jgi:DNA-binding winged helix-turn-helix (wHTH) protein